MIIKRNGKGYSILSLNPNKHGFTLALFTTPESRDALVNTFGGQLPLNNAISQGRKRNYNAPSLLSIASSVTI